MASLLDEYQLPADIPGYDLDPKELERMKYLGLMRFGLGLAGRERLGTAAGAGINTMIEGQTNARREMLARLQAYAERQKIEAIARQQAKEMAFIAKMTPEQRAKYGITEEVWSALQGSKDPAEKFFGSEFVKPYTLQPGQPRVIPGIGVTGAVANQQGQMPIFAPGGTTQLGTYNVPGYVGATEETAQATARGTGLGRAATEFEDVPVPGGRPGQTQKVLRSQLIGEQTANATQAAAQRTLQTFDAHIADEQGLLTKAIADNDPVRQRKYEENIKNLQAGKEKWQQYALTPTAPARISDPVAVKEAEARIPKTPEGFEWVNGELRRTRGGPEDTGIVDATAVTRWTERVDSIQKVISAAIDQVGYATAGIGGTVGKKIPGSPATDLAKKIDMVKANIGFQELNAMREVSKTGGALGQVAIQELNFLQSSLGSLDQEQSPEALRKNLKAVADHYAMAKRLMLQIAQEKKARAGGSATSFQSENDPAGIR